MGIRTRVSTRKGNPAAVRLLIEKSREGVIRKAQRAVKTVLEVATERTPKWTGEATEAWVVSFDRPAKVQASARYVGGLPELKYAGGMLDSSARRLTREVTAQRYREARSEISVRIKTGKPVKIFISNTAEHAQIWLDGQEATAEFILREVNRDFYTYKDIQTALRIRMKSQGVY